MDRGERRSRTQQVCLTRHRLKQRYHLECADDLDEYGVSPFCYAKATPLGCRCSKKTPGRPKVGHGICNCGHRLRVMGLRHVARKVRDLSSLQDVDWESDEVVLLVQKQVKRW